MTLCGGNTARSTRNTPYSRVKFILVLDSADPYHDKELRSLRGRHPATLLGCAAHMDPDVADQMVKTFYDFAENESILTL